MSISSSKELSPPFCVSALTKGKGTLVLQDFTRRAQRDPGFQVAITPRGAPPPAQPLPGNCQRLLRNGRSRTPAQASLQTGQRDPRPLSSNRATVHTSMATKFWFLLFQPWTSKLLPLPTELLKLFTPGHLPRSTPREEASSVKGALPLGPSLSRRA